MEISEGLGRLTEELRSIFADKTKLRTFLGHKGQLAQLWLDRMQHLADYPNTPSELRSSILKTMLRLSKNSGLHPRCLLIQNVRKLGDYPVAAGGFGDVWKGLIGSSTEPVCLKIVKIYLNSDVEKLSQEYISEAVIWRQMKHPNLLPFLGIYHLEHNQQLCLISPWMEKGNLIEYLRSTPRNDVKHHTLACDVAAGLHHLHITKIVHGDLKGVNVLITREGRACIGDFGLSRVADTHGIRITTSTSRPVGTARWLAPELLSGGKPSKESDIYSYGCVCFEIFTGSHPFPELANEMAVAFNVAQGKRMSRPQDITELTDYMWVLMESCWNYDPAARPSAQGVLSEVKPNNGNAMATGSWSDSLFSEIWNNVEHQSLDDALVLSRIAPKLSDDEKKRQEIINEIISFEKAFLMDMEYLRDIWIKRLQTSDVIPADRRTSFIKQVFWNIDDIITVVMRLRDALVRRQEEAEEGFTVAGTIGDIFTDEVRLDSFVSYGIHQLYAKYDFEKEKNTNPAFAAFVHKTESLSGSRQRKVSDLLSKPTTHLARHPLLLEALLNHTPDRNPDKETLPVIVAVIKEFLARVNTEMGKIENMFSLTRLDRRLVFKPGNEMDLGLAKEGRELIYNGLLSQKSGELQVYLLDHVLLFTKPRKSKEHEQLKVYHPPVPLQLLHISCSDDLNYATGGPATHQHTFWINFTRLGRKHSTLLLWANSRFIMEKWTSSIRKQQQVLQDRSRLFVAVPLSKQFFSAHNKVNCAAPLYERKVVYGAEDGVYIYDLRELHRDPVKVLALPGVLQIDVLEQCQLLIVLLESQVFTYPLDILDPNDPKSGLRYARLISSNTSFFKAGKCLGRTLICVVRSNQLSSMIQFLEPIDRNSRAHWQPMFRKLLQGINGSVKLFREFYLPIESWSIHFLKTKICVGCPRGFEIIDLETLDSQVFLHPGDESLEFVRKAETVRPMAFFRIRDEFLLCYDAFAFYATKTGMRARKEFLIHWEGTPTAFTLHGSYVLAFDRSFVEVRHIETGVLSQVIKGSNLRLMFAGPGFYYGPEPMNQHPPSGYISHAHVSSSHDTTYQEQDSSRRDKTIMVSDDGVVLDLRATD